MRITMVHTFWMRVTSLVPRVMSEAAENWLTMMLVMNLTSVAIVWFGAQGVAAGTMQTGDLIAFITYAMVIIMGCLIGLLGHIAEARPQVGLGKRAQIDAVEGVGTHAELMESCPEYREIALSQLSEEELVEGGAR